MSVPPRWKMAVWIAGSAGLLLVPLLGDAQPAPKGPDLTEFKTVETALTTTIKKLPKTQIGSPGYLGVLVAVEGKLIVHDVDDNSPAAKAGVQAGDMLLAVDGKVPKTNEAPRSILQSRSAGEELRLSIRRGDETLKLTASLMATSRALTPNQQRVVIGVNIELPKEGPGIALKSVNNGGPADKAGLKAGDVLLKLDGKALDFNIPLANALENRKPGDAVTFHVKPKDAEKSKDVKITLVAKALGKGGKGKKGGGQNPDASWDTRNLNAWKKDAYRLAIVCIEYPDVKHNDKITAKNWEESLFTRNHYLTTSVTGQKVFGSLNDYYQEQSFKKLHVQGKCFDFVTVSKKRSEYAQANTGPNKTALFTEALDKLLARDGKDASKDFDGIFFLYAGERVQTNRGGLYWPHRAIFTPQQQTLALLHRPGRRRHECATSASSATSSATCSACPISTPGPKTPAPKGVGIWCAMSNQVGHGKPQHFCAWSKEQLGWIKPAVIDPTVKQKLILSPDRRFAEGMLQGAGPARWQRVFPAGESPEEGLRRELARGGLADLARGGESANTGGIARRRRTGGAARVSRRRAVPEPGEPRLHAVHDAVEPRQLGGGLPVHITNIRRLPDGRITFYIGYEYY